MIEIELPDGSVAEFPDGTPEGKILSAVKQLHMRQTVEKNIEDVASKAAARTGPTEDEQRRAMFSPENRARAEAIRREGESQGAETALKYAPLAIGAATTGPVALGKAVIGGAVGQEVGGWGGRKVGKFVGFPEAGEKVGGTLGSLLGGLYASGAPLPASVEGFAARNLPAWITRLAGRGATAEAAPIAAATAPAIPAGASSSGSYSFTGVPNLSRVATPKIAPATTRAALEAIPQAGGGELAAVLAREPQLAAQAVATEAAPLAASASPKAVFEAAYKQALTAGKSAPEAATIARAARLQAGQAEQSTLVAKMMGQASEAPRPFVPDYMPGEVGIPLEPSGFAGGLAGLNQVASRFATVPQAAQATAQSLAARYPAFVEQSALLARMLGQ